MQKLENLTRQMTAVSAELDALKRRLGMYAYTYPDASGDGKITAEDAALVLEFISEQGSGTYASYPTEKEKWEAFAKDKGLENSVYPDVYGTGTINAEIATIIYQFTTELGAGNYKDTEEGFRAFMMDYDNVILGGVSGIRTMTEDIYSSVKKRNDVLYIVTGKNGTDLYLGDTLLKVSGEAVIGRAALTTTDIPQSTLVVGKAKFEEEEDG